ncbi:alpha/beta fold hydrolase [Sciscionella marina]|uniref:alpha/beta fold hydrolase n=1 Tax=Sciscionella marina TaxID=508770 RepID=UPI0003706E06|nr:alpha/beta hydrolase [Sciscionella marina]
MTATVTEFTTRFVDAGGVRTRYLEAGEGEPVVLLHGSGPGVTAEANWTATIPGLAGRYRVIAPEMIGFGATEREPELRYRIRTWVNHVIAFLDALELPRANLVGNSLGGIVSIFTALEHRERVRRMVLMGAPGVGMTMTEGLRALRAYEPSLDGMRDLLRQYFAHDPALVTEDLVLRRYQASAEPGEQENYRAIHAGQSARDNPMLSPDLVRTLSTPTLLVHGRDDRVLSAEISWKMANLLPNADLHLFHDCGHWAQIEHRDEFNRLVGDFFADSDTQGARTKEEP